MYRRRRTLVVASLFSAIVVIALVVTSGSGGGNGNTKARGGRTSGAHPDRPAPVPAIEAGLLPWKLDAALSREVVLPGAGDSVTVVGGLTASQASSPRIFTLHTANGSTAELGRLAAGTHDAAGAELLGRNFLLGGGTPNTVATVEGFASAASVPAPTSVTGTVVGSLPQPRSDSAAVTIGAKIYVVGGYDGSSPDPSVLSTTDGQHFKTVAALPISVRYAATAALGDRIYLFGGQQVGGLAPGAPVDAIQMVDTKSGKATVVGHLARPLAGAVAVDLGGNIYVAGGITAGSKQAVPDVWAFDPARAAMLRAGTLPAPVAFGAAGVVGGRAWLIGGEPDGTPVDSVEMMVPNLKFGTAGATGAGSPYFGSHLLVADRGNDRLLVLDTLNRVVWSYPSAYAAAPPGGFYFPDDAFFARHGTEIISNQEDNDTIVVISFPSGQLLWQYGHPRQASSLSGYLHTPDDAYLLKSGQVTIADAYNCRVLFINQDKTIASQIGTTSVCQHQPPSYVGSPNGDTPLADGNVLVSEINGSWISEYTPAAALVWTVHLPIHYPSDAQQLGPDLYLVSDYAKPGAIVEFNRAGQELYRYSPQSGPGELDHPSLTELLPSGVFMTNDDYRNRMVAVDPATQALVWQYGVDDVAGTGPGMLNTPDGFDILLPNGSTPTHPSTG